MILLLWAVLFFLSPANPAQAQSGLEPAGPPVEYTRIVDLYLTDFGGRPLPGVVVHIEPKWGRLIGTVDPADAAGRIRIKVQPAVEDAHAGKKVTDRFLKYVTEFKYTLTLPGYLDRIDHVDDTQEFASFAHPLYRSLDQAPSQEPLEIRLTLHRVQDFLAFPDQTAELGPAASALYRPDNPVQVTPRTLRALPEGLLRIGLTFGPLFDPEQYGLQAAGGILLREPVRDVALILRDHYSRFNATREFEFQVTAGFQYAAQPFALPVQQVFTYRLTAEALNRLITQPAGASFSLAGVDVHVQAEPLDISPEMDPDRIRQAPGGLLTPEGGKGRHESPAPKKEPDRTGS
jgi:hypothetical protein